MIVGHNNPESLKDETRANIRAIFQVLSTVGHGRTSEIAHWCEIKRKACKYALKYLKRRGIVARSDDREWRLTGAPLEPTKHKATKPREHNKTNKAPIVPDPGTIQRSDLTEPTPIPKGTKKITVSAGRKRRSLALNRGSVRGKDQQRSRIGQRLHTGFRHGHTLFFNGAETLTGSKGQETICARVLVNRSLIPMTESEIERAMEYFSLHGQTMVIDWGYWSHSNQWHSERRETLDPSLNSQPWSDETLRTLIPDNDRATAIVAETALNSAETLANTVESVLSAL